MATAVRVIDLLIDDDERSVALVDQYADLGLGFVDVSIVSVAERMGVTSLATLNHRDLRAVRSEPRRVIRLGSVGARGAE